MTAADDAREIDKLDVSDQRRVNILKTRLNEKDSEGNSPAWKPNQFHASDIAFLVRCIRDLQQARLHAAPDASADMTDAEFHAALAFASDAEGLKMIAEFRAEVRRTAVEQCVTKLREDAAPREKTGVRPAPRWRNDCADWLERALYATSPSEPT